MKTTPLYVSIALQIYTQVAKCSHVVRSVAITILLLQNVSGQIFHNLDFEQASIAPAPSGYTPVDARDPISATSAFPYWTVREDGTNCTAVWGTPEALDQTSVALVSPGYSPIQGNYSVQLYAFADAPPGYYHNASISQTGLIPVGTQSIQFSIASPYQASPVQQTPLVTLNGTPISLWQLSQSDGVITMGGDISSFAGITAEVTFLCQATQGGGFPANQNIFNLDDIQFSIQPVPEPSTLSLAALGGLLIAWRCRKSKQ